MIHNDKHSIHFGEELIDKDIVMLDWINGFYFHHLSFIQTEMLQFVNRWQCYSGQESEIQTLPPKRAGAKWQHLPVWFWSKAAV